MRKGMLFFSQYRTLWRIFLKNLKKYLRFVGPYRPGAFFLQDGVLQPTVWPLLCSDECGSEYIPEYIPESGGIGSVGPGGPVPPQIPAGRYVRPMRRNTARRSRTRILPSGPAAVLPGRVYAVLPGRVYVADFCWFAGTDARCFARPDLRCFAGTDARRFAGANAHCFVGPGALTGIFRTFVPEAVPCFWRRTR